MLKRWCSIKEIEVYLLCEIVISKDTLQGQKNCCEPPQGTLEREDGWYSFSQKVVKFTVRKERMSHSTFREVLNKKEEERKKSESLKKSFSIALPDVHFWRGLS